jgi:osmotically-inducible protein OsmY
MQRARYQRPVSVHATPSTAPGRNAATVAVRLLKESVKPDSTEVGTVGDGGSFRRGAQQQALEIAIRKRIESRLQGRVRNLKVRVAGGVVILEGQCATYYSKQLAQHAAMGILDDEHLENAIVVNVPK